MGLTPVPEGHLATVVTTLEMRERPRLAPMPPSELRLVRWEQPTLPRYRTLFARIGAPWLWYSRLVMADAALAKIIHDPKVSVYAAVDRAGIEVGFLELDHRHDGICELAYFGLVPERVGRGDGRWLMANALMLGWGREVTRLWVHTCTLDHHRALDFYRRSGFTAFRRTMETFPDPRITGILPPETAPQIPLLAPASRR
ncbi:GNAT family N-acetyltransferase [Sphingomonas sp. S1-29]|uniref:GNAT family N-acetyltransferase n=1 Tax=Sphingomonas sp. S1-29 TaxID=2991074 RepID=UPI00223FCFB8|nr:GNAT family N-acetyltransferase [Sphingomonas sp. S1-29]UZK69186.1 GNAT family N-acetyltransferase [Sphingomonas sp. S1-29]